MVATFTTTSHRSLKLGTVPIQELLAGNLIDENLLPSMQNTFSAMYTRTENGGSMRILGTTTSDMIQDEKRIHETKLQQIKQ